MRLAPRMIASLNILQASVPELNRMIDEKLSAQEVAELHGWFGPLSAPELAVRCNEDGHWQVFYREGHPPRLLVTHLLLNEGNTDSGVASPPTNEEGESFIF